MLKAIELFCVQTNVSTYGFNSVKLGGAHAFFIASSLLLDLGSRAVRVHLTRVLLSVDVAVLGCNHAAVLAPNRASLRLGQELLKLALAVGLVVLSSDTRSHDFVEGTVVAQASLFVDAL